MTNDDLDKIAAEASIRWRGETVLALVEHYRRARDEADALRSAIEDHREALTSGSCPPPKADDELWTAMEDRQR